VQASGLGKLLGVDLDHSGRVPVNDDLSVRGLTDVYAIGDIALTKGGDGKPLPALAQVAKQQGDYLGKELAEPDAAHKSFRFNNRGNTAVIGRNAAVFDFGRFQMKGRVAWLLWGLVHIYLLVGFENRFQVVTRWLWSYFTYERSARLIMLDGEHTPQNDQ
jgi:NADH dehydrogenase